MKTCTLLFSELPFQGGMDWANTSGLMTPGRRVLLVVLWTLLPVTERVVATFRKNFATAAAPGLVVPQFPRGCCRIDLDGDGDEGTGWVLIYMHMALTNVCRRNLAEC